MKRNKNRILIALLAFALFMQSVGAFFYFDYFASEQIGYLIYLVTKVLLVILPVLFYKFFASDIKAAKAKVRTSLFWGLVSGLAIMFSIYAFYILSPELAQSVSPDIIKKVEELQIRKFFVLFAIFLSIFHSLLEEFYWRWFVFGGLSMKMNYRLAAIISSAAFASHHFIVLKEMFPTWATIVFGVAIGFGGYIWCEIYHRTNSLKGAWISHAIADMAIMFIAYLIIT